METALVSIIMPMYNAGKFYQNLLKAFWNKPIRIGNYYSLMMEVKMILLILHLFMEKIQESFTENEQNMGIAKTRNKGIEASKGQYIAF